jgi:hypothetical protein
VPRRASPLLPPWPEHFHPGLRGSKRQLRGRTPKRFAPTPQRHPRPRPPPHVTHSLTSAIGGPGCQDEQISPRAESHQPGKLPEPHGRAGHTPSHRLWAVPEQLMKQVVQRQVGWENGGENGVMGRTVSGENGVRYRFFSRKSGSPIGWGRTVSGTVFFPGKAARPSDGRFKSQE